MTFGDDVQKIRKKNNGIAKDYAPRASELFDEWASDENDSNQEIYRKYADNNRLLEDMFPDLMSIGHEIADYISIRYTTLAGDITIEPWNDRVKVNMKPNVDETDLENMRELDVYIMDNYGNLTFKVEGIGANGRKLITRTKHDKNSAYEAIDECMRKLVPTYFASTRKNVRKSRKPIKKYIEDYPRGNIDSPKVKYVVHLNLNYESYYPIPYYDKESLDRAIQTIEGYEGFTLYKTEEYDGKIHYYYSKVEE